MNNRKLLKMLKLYLDLKAIMISQTLQLLDAFLEQAAHIRLEYI